MRWRLQSALMRLPNGLGYRIARALRLEKPAMRPIAGAATDNVRDSAPLTLVLEDEGRRKRLRVRAAGDVWSDEFREELARDRGFEASLVWRELVVLAIVAAVLAARTIFG